MSELEKMDAEIGRLQQEAAAVAQAGPTFDERWPEAEAQLLKAEAAFRQYGPMLDVAAVRPETAERKHLVAIGARMVGNDRAALIEAERDRIKRETANGVSAADKLRRTEELKAAIQKVVARRVLKMRATGGGFLPRPPAYPELTVYPQAALERLAAGR